MRVIVLNQSNPLRQVMQFITERGYDIDITAETDTQAELLPLVTQRDPDYLFMLEEDFNDVSTQIPALLDEHPQLGVALVNEEEQQVRLYKEGFTEKHPRREPQSELSANHWVTYSLSDFIALMVENRPHQEPPGGITDVEPGYPVK